VPSLNGQLDGPTVAAIRAYQSAAGLTMTGQPSDELLSSLQSAPRSAAAVMQSRRDQIMGLQRALNASGYDAGPEDGAIGPKVRSAIRMFQAKSGMPVTGEVSPELLAGLGISADGSTVQTTATTDTGGDGYGPGDAQVLQLEQSLTALGYKVGQVDGVYDRKTRKAISTYQKDNGLAEDGLATPALLTSVHSNLAARGGTTTFAVSRDSDLSTEQTVALQQSLGRHGYYSGNASGVYDEETQNAVRGYQRARGFDVTGNADASLVARLQAEDPSWGSAAVVRSIEEELSKKGYHVGPIDGQNDPQTQTAIDDFLRQAQINISDTPSEPLLTAIKSSSMTAREGARSEMFQSGIKAATDMFGSQ
jgi:peptidoglycan hydrolase-like protein with peptidoglycan-binding domain